MTRVLYVAYPLLRVHDESAGGAEQILWTLEREIARRGTQTAVAASAGSRVSGELFSTGEPCTRPDDYERRRNEHEDRVVEFVRRRTREDKAFNIIHDDSGSFWERAAEIDTYVLLLCICRQLLSGESFNGVPANVSFNCVSGSQARSFGDVDSLAGVVRTGLRWIVLSLLRRTKSRQGLLWLGRIVKKGSAPGAGYRRANWAADHSRRKGLSIFLSSAIF